MYKNLKHYRHTIHLYLDEIWKIGKNNKKARTSMYHWLSVQMNLPKEQTHASLFNRAQCKQAIKILRNKYMQLYGHDIPYTRKEKVSMKINTKLLQDMVSKAIKGAGNNKLIPITSLIGIEILSGKLTLKTTDGSNHLYITETLEGDSINFYSIVNADMFAKLVSKTTSEFIELLNNESCLEFIGNGSYKLEIPVNADGDMIKFPQFNIREDIVPQQMSINTLKNILSSAKVSIAKTMEVPCLTGYYIADKIVATNREMICLIEDTLSSSPILVSSYMAELLQLFEGNDLSFVKDENKLMFSTDKITVLGKELEGKDIYPVAAVENLAKSDYDNLIVVNKQDLLNVLDRMALFVTDYDKNGVYLNFAEKGLEIRSQKSNAIETIEFKSEKPTAEFNCLADIEMLKSQVGAIVGDIVNIYYGQATSLKLKEGNTTMILSLMQK